MSWSGLMTRGSWPMRSATGGSLPAFTCAANCGASLNFLGAFAGSVTTSGPSSLPIRLLLETDWASAPTATTPTSATTRSVIMSRDRTAPACGFCQSLPMTSPLYTWARTEMPCSGRRVRRSCQTLGKASNTRSPSNEVLLKAKGLPQNRCYHRHRKGGPVKEQGRREYAEIMRERYQQATKQERSALLDEYCRVTRCHRKAAIRRLGAAPVGRGRAPGRPARYGRDLLPVLERIWGASDQLSGKLLRPILPALVTALERHHGAGLAPAVRAALLAASPATLDRLLRPLRRRRPRQPRRLAPAVGSLRAQVPLRTWSEWT